MWSLVELVVVDAVDDRQVGAVGRGRDQHALGAGLEMGRGRLLAMVKMPVHSSAMSTPSALCGSLAGSRSAVTLILPRPTSMRVAVDLDLAGEAAVDAVEAQQVGVGLDRAEIVDRHDLDVLAARFDDGAQDVAADAAESVDRNPNCHVRSSVTLPSRRAACGNRLGGDAEMLVEVAGLGARRRSPSCR